MYKKYATHPADPFPLANSQRFLGLIGFAVVTLTWVFPVLDHTGVEPWAWPSHETGKWIGVNVLLDTIFNACFLVAIMLTSPLFVTLACIGTIPLSILTDHMMGKPALPHIAYLGVALIAVGFSCLGIDARKNPSKGH